MSTANDPPLTFESALSELEALVATMETGQLPLKESLTLEDGEIPHYVMQVDVLEKGVLKAFKPEGDGDA